MNTSTSAARPPTAGPAVVESRGVARRAWLLAGLALTLLIATALIARWSGLLAPASRPRNPGPSAKQLAAAKLSYPAGAGRQPEGLKVEYDAAADRTRMTLRLKDLPVSVAGANAVNRVELRLLSRFHGSTRPDSYGESVIDGSFSLASSMPGALAVSRPVGVFEAGGRTFELRPAATDKPAYSSKKNGSFYSERVSFKIDTADLLEVIAAPDAVLRIGQVTHRLSAAEIDDLREFAARLRPGN